MTSILFTECPHLLGPLRMMRLPPRAAQTAYKCSRMRGMFAL